MGRYLRLLRLFWRTSLLAELEYSLNFLLAVLSSLGHLIGNCFGLSLFYTGSGSLGGWPFHEALLVMGLFTCLQGLNRVLLAPNLARIVEHMRTGTLDFVLLKPIDTQFWLSTRRISPWGLPDVLFGVGIIVYALDRLGLPKTHLLWAVPPLLLSCVIQYSLWFILASISIWYVKVHNVTEVLNGLLAAGRYPTDALPAGAYRFVFTFVIPAALLTTVPARVVLGHATGSGLWLAAGFALAAFAFSRTFWRFALRYYTSASS
jgi:viologen exporter family transport system permease protein